MGKARCKIQDARYKIQLLRSFDDNDDKTDYSDNKEEYRMQDTGYRIQDTGYRIQDTGYMIQVIVKSWKRRDRN